MQPCVQVLDLLHQRLDLVLVRALDPASLSNCHVQGKLDGAVNTRVQPVAAAVDILRNDADPVLPAVGSAESETALGRSSLGDNAVVVVKCLFDSHEDADLGLGHEGLGRVVPGFGMVVAWDC